MTIRQNVDYSKIVEALAGLSAEGRSGTLFITSEDNHAAHFVLKEGKVCACGYRFKRGMAAVDAILAMNSASYRFDANIICAKSTPDLPNTDRLLALLAGRAGPGAEADNAAGKIVDEFDNVAGLDETDPSIAMVRDQLTRYLGPVAEFCCEDYLRHSAGGKGPVDIEDMIRALGKEIAAPAHRREFEERALMAFRESGG